MSGIALTAWRSDAKKQELIASPAVAGSMMENMHRLQSLVLVAILAGFGIAGAAHAATDVPIPAPRPPYTAPASATSASGSVEANHGSVFFLRGLLNVFSLGMDKLSGKLEARGIPSRVTNYTHWEQFAALLVDQYRTDRSVAPVVIVGHSLGGDAAVHMGNYLGRAGVPVRLVVVFDAVNASKPVGRGIAEVVNYYKPDGYGRIIKKSPEFTGKLVNVDLSDKEEIGHLNIDKIDDLHDEVIEMVLGIFDSS